MSCEELQLLVDYEAKCYYISVNGNCVSNGYIDYLYLFYCCFGRFPFLGYFLLSVWIFALFYMLGDTASKYFCSCLESLSKLLKLSPTIAGVTLLSLGNGAPDVFSSIVSFTGGGTSAVGFNTVLGGASVVTCVVAGVVSILVRGRDIHLDKAAFVRNNSFYFFVVAILLVIFLVGKINIWGAISFWLTYAIYVLIVYFWNTESQDDEDCILNSNDNLVPLLQALENGMDVVEIEKGGTFIKLCKGAVFFLEMIISIPRRFTIPSISEVRWSKFYFVSSMFLAPNFLATLWLLQTKGSKFAVILVHGFGVILGATLGVLAYKTSSTTSPPRKYSFLCLCMGFIMSMTWSYILAEELLGLLLSTGYIVGISPSVLGFTVMAWGNSIGDLITNSTMALKGGSRGAQIAISGCFAGPIFNIVFGLGLSMICVSFKEYPYALSIPWDPYLVETLGFLAGSLLWAGLLLLCRNGKLDALLGGGLIAIYFSSLALRLYSQYG